MSSVNTIVRIYDSDDQELLRGELISSTMMHSPQPEFHLYLMRVSQAVPMAIGEYPLPVHSDKSSRP